MRRFVIWALILSCFMCALCSTAGAEPFAPIAIDQWSMAAADKFYPQTASQTANRLITIYIADMSGNFVDPPVQLRLPVVTVTHKYYVQVCSDTHGIIGGYFNVPDAPQIRVAENAWEALEATAEHVQNYSTSYVAATQANQGYEAFCTGGYCTVTYNHTLWLNHNGVVVNKEASTIRLGYNFTETGTLAELLED